MEFGGRQHLDQDHGPDGPVDRLDGQRDPRRQQPRGVRRADSEHRDDRRSARAHAPRKHPETGRDRGDVGLGRRHRLGTGLQLG